LNLPGGIGTALKPAWEPILLARKPLDGTVADNVTRYGTGALNIDATRIGLAGDFKSKANGRPSLTGRGDNYDPAQANQPDDVGRWPANILLTHSESCVQVGTKTVEGRQMNNYTDGVKPFGGGVGHPHVSSQMPDEEVETWECVPGCPVGIMGDESRFFYVPKVSVSERNAGVNPCSCDKTQEWDGAHHTRAAGDTSPTRDITEPVTGDDSDSFTTLSGNKTMDQFQQDYRSTISTETSSTIESKTLSSSHQLNTNDTTLLGIESSIRDGSESARFVGDGLQQPIKTSTQTKTDGFSTEDVESAISPVLSHTNNSAELCAKCGGVIKGALRNSHPT
jgi:hypothetical protein